MGKLIISYDCEGMWGMMDKIDSLDKNIFNRNALLKLYQELLELHEKFNLKATFGFVGGFVSSRKDFFEALDKYPGAERVKKWCKPIIKSDSQFIEKDFFIPELLELVKNSFVKHEITSHGYSHVIMDNKIDKLSIDFELFGLRQINKAKKLKMKTIIFPRNIVNKVFLEKMKTIKCYRAPPYTPFKNSLIKRVYSLLKELIVICSSEKIYKSKELTIIPGSFFINWRFGPRKYVPIWLTIIRLRSALRHACKTNGIVHLWAHPHNLATGKKQKELLERIFCEVNYFKKNRSLKVFTLEEAMYDFNKN